MNYPTYPEPLGHKPGCALADHRVYGMTGPEPDCTCGLRTGPVRRIQTTVCTVLAEVEAERERQDQKWGEQNHPDGTGGRDPIRDDGTSRIAIAAWAKNRTDSMLAAECTYEAILTEEWAEALAETDQAKLRSELIQVAAVAVAWVEKIDRDQAKDATPTETVDLVAALRDSVEAAKARRKAAGR